MSKTTPYFNFNLIEMLVELEDSTLINNRSSKNQGCPRCNINKSEKKLQVLCENSPHIRHFEKKRIKCYDESTQKHRMLEPDCMIELVNGKRAGIELDGLQQFSIG